MLTGSGESRDKVGCQPIFEILKSVYQYSEFPVVSSKRAIKGLSTGFDELDQFTTGLRAGSLTVIAGRPCMGKTSLAFNIAQEIALTQSKSVAIFSLDFDREQAAQRILLVGSPMARVFRPHGYAADTADEPLDVSIDRRRNAPIYIDDRALSLPEIRRSLDSLISSGICPNLVVIDDLQKLAEMKDSEVVIRKIREIAREVGAAIILTSNLSRQPENRRNKRPCMSDLPIGVITGGTDLVITLFCEEFYDPESNRKGIAEISVMRNRYGRLGTLYLSFT